MAAPSEDEITFIKRTGIVRHYPDLPGSEPDQDVRAILLNRQPGKGICACLDLDLVLALTEVENRVVAVAGAELEHIRPAIAFQRVVAALAGDGVVSAAAIQPVGAAASVDDIRTATALDGIVAAAGPDDVGATVPQLLGLPALSVAF